MTPRVRPATTDADLADLTTIVNEVTLDDPSATDEMRWAHTTYPGGARFLAMEGKPDRPAVIDGCHLAGPNVSWVHPRRTDRREGRG